MQRSIHHLLGPLMPDDDMMPKIAQICTLECLTRRTLLILNQFLPTGAQKLLRSLQGGRGASSYKDHECTNPTARRQIREPRYV